MFDGDGLDRGVGQTAATQVQVVGVDQGLD